MGALFQLVNKLEDAFFLVSRNAQRFEFVESCLVVSAGSRFDELRYMIFRIDLFHFGYFIFIAES